jgi:hypothetical protein
MNSKVEEVHGGGDEDGDGCPSPRREGAGEDDGVLEEQRKDDPPRKPPNNPRDLVGDLNHE